MASMKKHQFIVDFDSGVKLSPAELKKLKAWIRLAESIMPDLLQDKKLIDSSWIKHTQSIYVSVYLCGDARMKKLNAEHRGKSYVTDVLSFPGHESLRLKRPQTDFKTPELFLGDLVICHQQTKRQARQFDISYFDEFIHLFMHGVIHLLGYDHELSAKEEKLMQGWEKKALDQFSKAKKKGARRLGAPPAPLRKSN